MTNILDKILKDKKKSLEVIKKKNPIDLLEKKNKE